ncbi:MAG: DUF72 domain-containing protein [Candidatus Fermentibacteraceae bacterium]|nr:DUF72 domain-containing protein [Candidatus Fermentibacteraceae bacterium]MBN2608093.1 DUF72 domain-containing protein [Candidatus Fermentibacteraceae bacterium]
MTGEIKKNTLRIGTSGYSFADWVGPFYPKGTEKGKMLDYYCGFFSTVEINSTYYRIMHPRVSWNIVNKTPEDFDFMVKLHASMTHSRDATPEQWDQYGKMLEPFKESRKLAGLLAQFPYSFKPSEPAVRYVEELNERTGSVTLAVEFRYDEWYDEGILRRLSGDGMALVSVDLPGLPHLPPPVPVGGSPFGYLRMHGRNTARWWEGGPLRYDYTYSDQELAAWFPAIDRLGEGSGTVFVMFNNCHFGQAVRDAIRLKELFTGEEK